MKNKSSLCGHKQLQALTVMDVKCSVLSSGTILHARRLFCFFSMSVGLNKKEVQLWIVGGVERLTFSPSSEEEL